MKTSIFGAQCSRVATFAGFAAIVCLIVSTTVMAQVGPAEWSFEIDGDHGSNLKDVIQPSNEGTDGYLSGTYEVEDGFERVPGQTKMIKFNHFADRLF